jgi:chromosome segregation ATPase
MPPRKKKVITHTPQEVEEKRVELLEGKLNTLSEENTDLSEEVQILRDKLDSVNIKMASATKHIVDRKGKPGTIYTVGEDRYEFQFPRYSLDGRKLTAEEISKDLELLARFVEMGNAWKI